MSHAANGACSNHADLMSRVGRQNEADDAYGEGSPGFGE
jgi:hypothetical protein